MSDDKTDLSSPGGSASPGPGTGGWRVLERLGAYMIDDRSIVLGTWDPLLFDEDLRTGIEQAEYRVAVDADQIDMETREGWFVLVQGAAHHLDTQAEREPFIDAGLEPWLEGVPAHFIRVNPASIWGNRIRPA